MRTMTLLLDEDDYRDVQRALAQRQTMTMPDTDSNLVGGLIAEICRTFTDWKGMGFRGDGEEWKSHA
jgi:hypothetical protein